MRERTVLVHFERFLEFAQGTRGVIHFFELLTATDRHRDLDAGIESQQYVGGIERQLLWLSECIDTELGGRTRDLNLFVFGVSFRLNSQVDGHAEGVQILSYFSDHPESLLGSEDGIFELEFGRTARLQPLHKEVPKLLVGDTLKDFAEIFTADRLPGIAVDERFQTLDEVVGPNNIPKHVQDGRAFR